MNCGCKIRIPKSPKPLYIEFCPLHAAAEELLEAARATRDLGGMMTPMRAGNASALRRMIELATVGIAKAEGRKP